MKIHFNQYTSKIRAKNKKNELRGLCGINSAELCSDNILKVTCERCLKRHQDIFKK